MDKESKNKSKKLIIITVALLLAIITIFNYNSSYAIENETYTREEMQDMIVSTAMSYFQNNYYSDYGQKALDYLGVTENYYKNATVYWRDLNVTPEMPGRSNYYHIDCSGFTFITYLNTLGYDMSEYSDINSYMLFYQANTYKMRRVNDYSDTLTYHRAAYKRFGQAWNNGFLKKVANKISGTCTTDACSTSSKTGIVYNNLDNSKDTELAYYYVAKESDTATTVKAAYAKVKDKLQPGDIVLYTKDDSSGNSSGHVMLYVGQIPGFETASLLHSTGSDYNTEPTSEKNRLRKSSSILRSVADTYIDQTIQNVYDNGGDINLFAIFRPINTVCKSDSVCKASYNSNNVELTETQLKNNKARVELKSLRKEQYMTQNKNYNTSLNPTTETKDGNTTNINSKFNSINIGDEITYNLRLTNKHNTNSKGLTITAKVPEGSTYVTGSCNYSCTISNGIITWKNQTISDAANSNGTYKTYKYTVKATKEGTLKNEGMLVTTASGNELQMSSLSITVNPTQNGINKEILMNEVKKFQNLVKEGKITYSSSGSRTENIKDLDTLTSANISQLGFIKSVYYNAFNLDLDMLEGTTDTMNSTKIKNGIFKKMEYPATKNDGTEYTGDKTTNVYARLTSSGTSTLTGIEANINKMLVPGMFGGRQMKGNDTNTRIKFLRSFKNDAGTQSDLEPGDIIVTYYSNAAKISSWLYLGMDNYGPVLARFESNDGLVIYTDEHLSKYYSDTTLQADTTKKPTNQILNEIFSQNLFVVLRPSRLGTTVSYNYNGGIEGTNSYVAYNTYKNLVTPIKNSFTTKLEYNKTISGATTSFTRTNTFDGWSYNGTIVEDETTLQTTENHTLKAEWNIKSIELPSPTVAGYTLEGWYSDSALTKKTGNAGASYTPESNGTLYAKWKANEYQIKYNANGGVGTMTNSSHTYDVEKKLTANTFTREGYTFAGWSTTSNGNVIYQDNVNIKNLASSNGATVNLYAIWEEASETEAIITVKVENGTIDKATQTVNYNESATFTINPNAGYNTPSVTCTNNQIGTIQGNTLKIENASVNTTCTVIYKANTYEIKYDPNTGVGTMKSSTHIYDTEKQLNKNTFTKEGYTFAGWNTSPETTTIIYKDQTDVENLTSTNGGVITLYAVWQPITYEVQYNANTGIGTMKNSTHTYDEEKALTANTFTKIGYKFSGWALDEENIVLYQDEALVKNLTETKGEIINLYAVWTPITYEVKYDANGGTGTMENTIHKYDEDKQLSSNSFTKEGYIFLGWSKIKTATEANFFNEDIVTNLTSTDKEVVTLYAIWQDESIKQFTVKLNVENGTASETTKVIPKNESATFTLTPNIGYSNPIVSCTNEQITTIENNVLKIENVTANTTCTVTYNANTYEVKYNANGGIGTMANSSHTYDEAKELSKNKFTKAGYTFAGWSTRLNGEIEYIDEENVRELTETNNDVVNLYAVWKIVNYTIKYNLDNSIATNPETYNVETETFKLNPPVKEGYKFIGWTGSNGTTPEKEVTITKGTTGNKEYTANYEETKYKIAYKSDENGTITGIKSEEVTYKNSPQGTTSKPNEGYQVLKWSIDKDVTLKDGTIILKGAPITEEQIKNIVVTEDLILTIYHYQIKYSITYESSENGTISGIESEEVAHGSTLLGTEVSPSKGYVLAHYLADKDVTLTTGEVIKANSPITKENLSRIIVKEDIKITAIYEIATYKVTYESDENGIVTGIKEETKKYNENPSGTTVSPNKNYELLKWTGKKEVTLKDGSKIAKGDVITEEEIKQIILDSDLTLTAHHIKTIFTVYYKNETGTNITGILKEELKEGETLKGTTVKPENLNSSIIFKANKDVTLKDGSIIKQGNVIKPEQLTNIIVKEDLILTAYELKNSSANVNVPDTGSNKSLLIVATGIALISLGGYVFYKRKSLNK